MTIDVSAAADTTSPTGSISINGGATYTTNPAVALTPSASDPDNSAAQIEMRFSNDGSTWSGWEPYVTTKAWTLPSGDGNKTVYAQYEDTAHNVSTGTITATIILDTTAPVITVPTSVTVEAGTDPSGAVATFSVSAVDAVDGPMAATAVPASGSRFLPGTTTVNVTATDKAGNTAEASFKVTVMDDPTGSLGINSGAAFTNSGSVTLSLAAHDADGLAFYKIANGSSASGATAVAIGGTSYSGTVPWELSTGDGSKTVAVEYGDVLDHWSVDYTVTIVLDTNDPVVTITQPQNGHTYNFGSVPPLAYSVIDANADPSQDQTTGYSTAAGPHTMTVTATDKAGNTGSASVAYAVKSGGDVTPPTGSLGIRPSGLYTRDLGIALVLAASDDVGVTGYRVTNGTDPTKATMVRVTSTKSFSRRLPWNLPAHDGRKTLAVQYLDAAGNWSPVYTSSIILDRTLPTITVPANMTVYATSRAGAVVTFTCTAVDKLDPAPSLTLIPASGSVFPLGTTVVQVRATDAAGNRATKRFTVAVVYGWAGFQAPIDANGSSIFKLGSTVPVGFKLNGPSADITNAVARLSVKRTSSRATGTVMEPLSTLAPSSGRTFRYDSSVGQYYFYYGTAGLSPGTYVITVDLGDGLRHTVTISLKRS